MGSEYLTGENSRIREVDLTTGACTIRDRSGPPPLLLRSRSHFAAACLPSGRIVCAGGDLLNDVSTTECRGQGTHPAGITAEVLIHPRRMARMMTCGGGENFLKCVSDATPPLVAH